MKNIVIAYGSTTGNTEQVANLLAGHLDQHQVAVYEVSALTEDLVAKADLVLLGASTWGYGEVQDDFAAYMSKIDGKTYGGKSVAVFGCGDQAGFGDVFCEAVTLIEEAVQAAGGGLVTSGLRVDGDVSDNLQAIQAFAKSL